MTRTTCGGVLSAARRMVVAAAVLLPGWAMAQTLTIVPDPIEIYTNVAKTATCYVVRSAPTNANLEVTLQSSDTNVFYLGGFPGGLTTHGTISAGASTSFPVWVFARNPGAAQLTAFANGYSFDTATVIVYSNTFARLRVLPDPLNIVLSASSNGTAVVTRVGIVAGDLNSIAVVQLASGNPAIFTVTNSVVLPATMAVTQAVGVLVTGFSAGTTSLTYSATNYASSNIIVNIYTNSMRWLSVAPPTVGVILDVATSVTAVVSRRGLVPGDLNTNTAVTLTSLDPSIFTVINTCDFSPTMDLIQSTNITVYGISPGYSFLVVTAADFNGVTSTVQVLSTTPSNSLVLPSMIFLGTNVPTSVQLIRTGLLLPISVTLAVDDETYLLVQGDGAVYTNFDTIAMGLGISNVSFSLLGIIESGTNYITLTASAMGFPTVSNRVYISNVLDTDNDGLPDLWEYNNFGDLNNGPTDDPDNDGLNNLSEYQAVLDPNDYDTDDNSITDYDEDTDGDELSNGAEQDLYGTNPGNNDTDDDTFSDSAEVNGGIVKGAGVNSVNLSSPLYSRSPLKGASMVMNGSAITLPEPLEFDPSIGAKSQRFAGLSNWVVACYAYVTNTETGSLIIRKTSLGYTNFDLRLDANVPSINFGKLSGGAYYRVVAPRPITTGTWVSIMGYWQSDVDKLSLWIDGISVTSKTIVAESARGIGATTIGAGIAGLIDDVYIGVNLWDLGSQTPDYMLILDNSGSMSGQPLIDVKNSARNTVDKMPDGAYMAIISFNSTPNLEHDFTNDKTALKTAIDNIIDSGGGTDFPAALQLALTTFQNRQSERPRMAIFMSDGFGGDPGADLIQQMKDEGIVINTIGFGDALSGGAPQLQSIADGTGGKYYFAPTSTELQQIMTGLLEFNSIRIAAFYPFDDQGAYAEDLVNQLEWDYAIAGATFDTATFNTGESVFNWMFTDTATAIPVWWSAFFFGETDAAPDDDPDADGLNNLQEYLLGYHPFRADTDANGLRDDIEDADGDEIGNYDEFNVYGTNPRDLNTDDDAYLDGDELNGSTNKNGYAVTSPIYSRSPCVGRSILLGGAPYAVPEPLVYDTVIGSRQQRFASLDQWFIGAMFRPAANETGVLIQRVTSNGKTNLELRVDNNIPTVLFTAPNGFKYSATATNVLPAGQWTSLMGSWLPTNDTLTLLVNDIPVVKKISTSICATGPGYTRVGVGVNGNLDDLYIGRDLKSDTVAESLDYVLMLDISGSMYGQPLLDLQNAARQSIDMLPDNSEMAIITFSDEAQLAQIFTSDHDALKLVIDSLQVGGGETNYDPPLEELLGLFQDRDNGRERMAIMISDGVPTTPTTLANITSANNAGIMINTIGFGFGGGQATELQNIANNTGGNYYPAPDGAQLQEIMLGLITQTENALLYAFYPFDDGGVTAEDFAHQLDWRYAIKGPVFDTTIFAAQDTSFNWMFNDNFNLADRTIPDWWIASFFVPADFKDTNDEDGDGLGNFYEYLLGLNPLVADTDGDLLDDGYEDADGDGLSNLEEQDALTDPMSMDTDDDGLSDRVELDYGISPLDSVSPYVMRYIRNDGAGWISAPATIHGKDLYGTRFDLARWTLEAMVRLAATPTQDVVLVGRYCEPANRATYELGIATNCVPYIRFNTMAGQVYRVDGTRPLALGRWTMIGGRFGEDEASEMALSLFQDTVETSHTIGNVFPINGAQRGDLVLAKFLDGDIDEVRIWNVARKDSEISSMRGKSLLFGADPSLFGALSPAGGYLSQLSAGNENLEQWTIQAWFKTTQDGTLIAKNVVGGRYNYSLRLEGGLIKAGVGIQGNVLASSDDPLGGGVIIRTVMVSGLYEIDGLHAPANDDKWHHVAFVNDGTILTIFYDGLFAGFGQIPPIDVEDVVLTENALPEGMTLMGWSPNPQVTVVTGSGSLDIGSGFAGIIDEVSIINQALSYSYIRDHRFEKPSGNNLVSYYDFDGVDSSLGAMVFNNANQQVAFLIGTAAISHNAGDNAPIRVSGLDILRSKLAAYWPMDDGRWVAATGTVEDFSHRMDWDYAARFQPSTNDIDFTPVSYAAYGVPNPYYYPQLFPSIIDTPWLTDSDNDSMPDIFEQYFGLDASVQAAAGDDQDGDGLEDVYEYYANTDPRYHDSNADGVSDFDADVDGDGLSNGEESMLRTHPSLVDSDDDGIEDGVEVVAHTDPASSLSPLFDRALKVPGNTNSYVQFADQDRYGLSNWVVEAWINPTSMPSAMATIVGLQVDPGITNYFLGLDPAGRLVAGFTPITLAAPIMLTNATPIQLGTWVHVLAGFDSLTRILRIDLDGMLAIQKVVSQRCAFDGIGPYVGKVGAGFPGYIDEVRIWTEHPGARSPSQLRKTLVGTETNLVSYLRFDDGTNPFGTSGYVGWNWGQVEDFTQLRNWRYAWLSAATAVGSVVMTNVPGMPVTATTGDDDLDGLPNSWESIHGLNPNSAGSVDGAAGDADGDGLSNLYEYRADTDPWLPDSNGNGVPDGLEDADGDGLSNIDEQNRLTRPDLVDTDDDGLADKQEIDTASDPRDSVKPFIMRYVRNENGDGTIWVDGIIAGKDDAGSRFDLTTWTLEGAVRLVQLPSFTGQKAVMVQRKAGANGYVTFEMGVGIDDKPYALFQTDIGATYAATGLTALVTNEWIKLAARVGEGEQVGHRQLDLFTQYEKVTRNLSDALPVCGIQYQPLVIASNLVGDIDEIRVWNVARGDEEITRLRNRSLLFGEDVASLGILSLPGDSSYLHRNYSEDIRLTNSFTVEAWFRTTSPGVILQRDAGMSDDGENLMYNYRLEVTASNTVRALCTFGIHPNYRTVVDFQQYLFGTITLVGEAEDIRNGNWHFVTFTFDGRDMTLYYDGLKLQSRTFDNRTDQPRPGSIAWHYPLNFDPGAEFGYDPNYPLIIAGGDGMFKAGMDIAGALDEIRIFASGSTEAEISARRFNKVNTKDQNLRLYYDFDDLPSVDDRVVTDKQSVTNGDGYLQYNCELIAGSGVNAPVQFSPFELISSKLAGYWPMDDGQYPTNRRGQVEDFIRRLDADFAGTFSATNDIHFVVAPISDAPWLLDSDGDGMADWFEVLYNLDPNRFSSSDHPELEADGDLDGDGMSNLDEYLAGTNPTISDTDNDGVWDGNEDTDGDGIGNFSEIYIFGTDPLNKDTDDDGIQDGVEVNTAVVKADGRRFTSPVYSRSPLVQRSLNLDGMSLLLNDPIETGGNNRFDLAHWTIECWIMLTNAAPQTGAIIERVTQTGFTNFALRLTANVPTVEFSSPSGQHLVAGGSQVILTNTWTHLAGVWDPDNDSLALYVNGIAFQAQVVVDDCVRGRGKTRIGSGILGQIDDLRIWGVARSAAQIADSMYQYGVGMSVDSAWAEYDDHYYEFTTNILTWHEADLLAESKGGHLPIVNDEDENDYLRKVLTSLSNATVWIGASDDIVEGSWRWVDGTPVGQGYVNWMVGSPDNGGQYIGAGEDFASMIVISDNPTNVGMWVDVAASNIQPVVIEYERKLVGWFPFDDGGLTAEDFVRGNDPDYVLATSNFNAAVAVNLIGDIDTDADGLPDWWEFIFFRGAAVSDEDPDRDGLSNLYDYYVDTNPLDDDSDNDGTPDGAEDYDGDGLSNAQEQEYGTDPRLPDTDDDGILDSLEFTVGSSPVNALDPFVERVLRFDGTPGSYLEMPNQLRFALSNFLVEAWINPTVVTNCEVIARQVGPAAYNYKLGIDGLRHPYIMFTPSDFTADVSIWASNTVPDDAWTHLAGRFDKATCRLMLYVNGQLRRSFVTAKRPALAGPGPFEVRAGKGLDGMMDEVRFWSVYPGGYDFTNIVAGGFVGPTEGPLGSSMGDQLVLAAGSYRLWYDHGRWVGPAGATNTEVAIYSGVTFASRAATASTNANPGAFAWAGGTGYVAISSADCSLNTGTGVFYKLDMQYTRDRTLAEIDQFLGGNEAGLVAYYRFDDRTNTNGTSGVSGWTRGQMQDFLITSSNDWLRQWENGATLHGAAEATRRTPGVIEVTSPDPNGTYYPGNLIRIWVRFSEDLFVLGTPRIELNTGSLNVYAFFDSLIAPDTMELRYVVGANDWSWDLDYVAVDSLSENGGVIWDSNFNNIDPTLPPPGNYGSLGWNKDILVDPPEPYFGGLPASWLQKNFPMQALGSVSGGDDPDNDGLSNLDEFYAGTDPNDAMSVIAIERMTWDGAGFEVVWRAVIGRRYRLEFSDDYGGTWQAPELWRNIYATGDQMATHVDAILPAGGVRMYRIALELP